VTLRIGATTRKDQGIAALALYDDGDERVCELDLQYSLLSPLRNRNPLALDFLLLASSVYALDKSFSRDAAHDRWTRQFSLTTPVSDQARWRTARPHLVECLQFLTGDSWTLKFSPQTVQVLRPTRTREHRRSATAQLSGDAVCLFSGGLDSLVGAIDLLEGSTARILLIGHHDGDMGGPFGDQRAILERLRTTYPGRISSVLVRVGQQGGSTEITLRARSLLFIALGVFAASAVGSAVPVVIPENGTIALNVPLTPSRRGSCSTRTAHPDYLHKLHHTLERLGFRSSLLNPLSAKTKGEVVAQCMNQQLVREVVHLSVSCAKRSHRREWIRRDARSCGRCMPCIYRRGALHTIGLDTEVYGIDICADEVDVDGNDEGGSDLRACLSFLRRQPSPDEISRALLASGSLDIRQLRAYADLVIRAMNEIRSLLRDKGKGKIQRAAGLWGR
jgi:hypothetical protein